MAGTIEVDGTRLTGGPRQARRLGSDIVPGDRTLAAFADLSVRENLFPTGTTDGSRAESSLATRLLEQFGVRRRGAEERTIMTLSGGNQQKVIFARAVSRAPKIVVLIDPTAGIDIGARHEMHNIIRAAAHGGAAILFGSSDFEEVAGIVDRAIVAHKGAPAAEVSGDSLTWNRLLHVAQDTRTHTLIA